MPSSSALTGACGACRLRTFPGGGAPNTRAPRHRADRLPKRGEITRSITLPSFRILAYQEATLYAKVSGYLKTLTVDKGDAVKEGQLLAEIEVPELLADEAQYKAETAVSRTNYERMAEARAKAPDLVIPQTVDDLRGQWEVAQAKLQRTQTLLQYARIIAPFDGRDHGAFRGPGRVYSRRHHRQHAAKRRAGDAHGLPPGAGPGVRAGAGSALHQERRAGTGDGGGVARANFPGTVTRFAHALDEATKTMLTEIEMPNPSGDLRPGAYASVRLEVERKADALLVPVPALVVEKAGTSVFTVADGKAKKTPVQTGFNDGVNVELLNVKLDQPVILVGKQTLTDGQPVNVGEAK